MAFTHIVADDYQTFRRIYETPILKSRAPGCSTKETELGEARSTQVSDTVSLGAERPFIDISFHQLREALFFAGMRPS